MSRGTTHTVSSLCGQTLIQRVCELINLVTNQRDEDLVKSVLNEEDVGVILGIPLWENIEDFLGWHFDSKGLFSVKSTYKVSRNYAYDSHGLASVPLFTIRQWALRSHGV